MKALLTFFLLVCGFLHAAPLRPEEAFQVSLARVDEYTLEAQFHIKPGYYLYRDRFAFSSETALEASFLPAQDKIEPETGHVAIYAQSTAVRLSSKQPITDQALITLRYQGCAEGQLCYPPQTLRLRPGERSTIPDALGLGQATQGLPARNAGAEQTAPKPTPASAQRQQAEPVSASPSAIKTSGNSPFGTDHWATLGFFLLAGLGLSLTACMYPLIPIVSGIVLGNQHHSRARALGLTFTYVQGLALSYTLIGIAAAATGTFLTVALQQPAVIAAFAGFFVLMALAMFGFFNLHLPSRWLSALNAQASRLPGGHYGPVLVMGSISALIVGPCNIPPLAAALAYLGRTGDLVLGGAALYAMALGMGLPLLGLGWFGHALLPRLSARAMLTVRLLFGLGLIGMATWVAQPLWTKPEAPSTNPQYFQTLTTTAQLDAALRAARGQAVLLDFYADWCVSCKELERKTINAPAVRAQLSNWVLLRADITGNTEDSRQLMQRFGLFAPPALVFFDQQGQTRGEPVIGFIEPDVLMARLNK